MKEIGLRGGASLASPLHSLMMCIDSSVAIIVGLSQYPGTENDLVFPNLNHFNNVRVTQSDIAKGEL